MNREMPTINDSAHSHNVYNAADIAGVALQQGLQQEAIRRFNQWETTLATKAPEKMMGVQFAPAKEPQQGATAMANPPRRLVQVFIADTHESVPLADCLLYSGPPRLTDLTDQELFFDVDIRAILEAHNAKRVKLIDKSVKDRTEHLEPARVRDLRMTVTTIASF